MTHPDDLWTGVVWRPKNRQKVKIFQRHLTPDSQWHWQNFKCKHSNKKDNERTIQADNNPVSSQYRSRCAVEVWTACGCVDVLLSALSRASSQSRQWTLPLIFTAPGCFDSKPNDRIDTSILYEDLWSLLTMAAAAGQQLFQLLLHLQCFHIKFSSLK